MERKKVNSRYSFNDVEGRWREKELNRIIKFKKHINFKYILEMLPYPSGKIHMGHIRNYTVGEILHRFYYLKGVNIQRYIGWDAFGLPAENAAIENGLHPKIWTENNIKNMKQTLQNFGFLYDWDHEISTCDVSYYKHQQELFIKMYKNGHVIRKKDWVNWDPVAMTVVANEQVDDNGRSWRSGALVEKKQIEQWFFNISRYAEELLNDLSLLEGKWPDKIITMQRNWIGKSEGCTIDFKYKDTVLKTFTTKPETVFGCTFIAISSESTQAIEINAELTQKYLNTPENLRKTCILGHCTNTYTGEDIPIYIADYVLNSYGTGAVMGVPLYDERDNLFANEHHIPKIKLVDDDGLMINSGFLNGMTMQEARAKMISKIGPTVHYRLKDWCISRQRYWGCPIPIYYCPNCGLLPEERLPVILPGDVKMDVKGNPLSYCEDFVNVECAKCGAMARRETDTMDTFVDSSWYQFRYPCSDNINEIIDSRAIPVDIYLGGAEHAVLHLLYARFVSKAMRDMGMFDVTEPFKSLINQGMVCHVSYKGKESGKFYYPEEVQEENGKFYSDTEEIEVGPCSKMSKSEKNVVDPIVMMNSFGTDSLKMFVISDSPVEKDFDWNTNGLFGCHKFLQSIWRMTCAIEEKIESENKDIDPEIINNIDFYLYEITRHLESVSFNLYIAQIRIFFNFILDNFNKWSKNEILYAFKHFLRVFWVVSPALCYECYEILFNENLAEVETWIDGKPLDKLDIKTIVVQVNGIKRAVFKTELSNKDEIIEEARKLISGTYGIEKKFIYVPGKIVNFVI